MASLGSDMLDAFVRSILINRNNRLAAPIY
ncbi:hypothetical protein CORC01_04635 [Colletotrichum orchidophilum]|uniref:Uncharacterized protein n=1 Tax=Colletotrichum orchidophilum TaxID=1209926 RepID=A0A1G4BF44_9PEZI|nr:uncharacterized protein CORC01_04635 [Colletotrichum orchidophilum]OHE99988.1 hypothetical protein CORC01_04635 [Colletotrichum orchidophilum]